MLRKVSVFITAAAIIACGSARAQDAGSGSGPGLVEVTVIPAGAAFFSSKNGAPSFGNYGLGTAVTYNVNNVIGVEGEFGAMIATTSDLQFGDLNHHTKAPNFMNYNVNAIVTAASLGAARVYAAGGVGGLTMFERAGLGVTGDTTFLVGNVGGGVKWYAANSRWGLRGDYRLVVNRSSDTAPSFFGTESRYGHRLYAGVIVNAAR
jgi:hypothetical protein